MGLDMYLEKKNLIDGCFSELCCWRKANQIRQWFCDHLENGVENCTHSLVTKEDIEELIDTCKIVLKEHSLAASLLPTTSGFFFGSTSYDEWYFEELESLLIKADIGVKTVMDFIDRLRKRVKHENITDTDKLKEVESK